MEISARLWRLWQGAEDQFEPVIAGGMAHGVAAQCAEVHRLYNGFCAVVQAKTDAALGLVL